MAGFGGAVKLEGESEYRKALNQITQNLREVSSEMRATTSQFDKNDRSAEALAAQSDVLNKKFDEQKRKLSLLEDQYESMEDQYQENAAAHNKLIADYDQEKTKLAQIEASLGQTSDEYKAQAAVIAQYEEDVKKSTRAQEANEKSMSQMRIAINNARTDVNKTAQEIENLGKEAETAGDKAEDSTGGWTLLGGTIANMAADVLQNATSALKDFVSESATAYSKFQAATGASAEEMEEFKGAMNDLYKENYGESLEDIGDKMAYIKQVMGETDPTVLKELAANAMTLEDTFGSDFRETVRGVTNLMKHFGLDSQTAFDLFARGSQNGLDYTSELGDNIAEYGGNFKQAGYSADEYFQLLENGSKGGAYNLDKVNDSINEIKNRLGDGTIEDSLGMFSKETQTTFKAWQKGEKTMKDVINSIVKEISECENEQEALTKAAKAFGTMGEDANLDVVKSLTTLGDSYKDVEGAMKDLKDVRYDNVVDQIGEIGRTLKTDLLLPLAEKVLPHVKELMNFVIDNGPEILNLITAIGAGLVAFKATTIIGGAVTAFQGFFATIQAGQGVVAAFNAVMAANPVGAIAVAVGLLTAGVVGLIGYMKETSKETNENAIATDELRKRQEELTKEIEDNTKARQENVNAAGDEAAQAEFLLGKLEELSKKENKSNSEKEEMKRLVAQLNALVPELALAYDDETDSLNLSTEAIRDNIKAQKELALAKAYQENAAEIIKEIVKVEKEHAAAIEQKTKNQKAYEEAAEAMAKFHEEYGGVENVGWWDAATREKWVKLSEALENSRQTLNESKEAVSDYEDTLKSLDEEYENATDSASKFIEKADITKALSKLTDAAKAAGKEIPQSLTKGMEEGRYAIPEGVDGLQKMIEFDQAITNAGFDGQQIPKSISEGVLAGTMSVSEAMEQVKAVMSTSDEAAKKYEEGLAIPKNLATGIQEGAYTVDEANQIMQDAINFEKARSEAQAAGFTIPQTLADSVRANELLPSEAINRVQALINYKKSIADAELEGVKVPETFAAAVLAGEISVTEANNAMNNWIKFNQALEHTGYTGDQIPSVLADKLLEGKVSVEEANTQMNRWIQFQAALASSAAAGDSIPDEIRNGILDGKLKPADAIQQLNDAAGRKADELPADLKASGKTSGEALVDGTKSGVNNNQKKQSLWSTIVGLGKSMLSNLQSSIDAHSPSREAAKIGGYFLDGVNNGVANRNKRNSIFSSIFSFGSSLLSNLKNSLQEHSPSKATEEMGVYLLEGLGIGIDKEKDGVIKDVRGVGQEVVAALQDEVGRNIQLGALQASGVTVSGAEVAGVNAQTNSALVAAFKEAMSGMKVELDGEAAGEFVDKTVSKLIFS